MRERERERERESCYKLLTVGESGVWIVEPDTLKPYGDLAKLSHLNKPQAPRWITLESVDRKK